MTETAGAPATAAFPDTRPPGCPFDPAAEYRELRESAPVSKVSCPVGVDAWLVTRYEDVRSVLADPRLNSRAASPSNHVNTEADLDAPANPGSILHHDGPEHSRLRRLLTPEFTVKRIQAMRPYIAELVDQHLDAMLAGTEADLYHDFGLPIPSLVICELLGVPYADREMFQAASGVLLKVDITQEQRLAASGQIQGYMAQLVMTKLANPTDEDLLGRLIQRANASGTPLTVEELVTLGISLLIAGHETTANMIALSAAALLRHPDRLAELRADPSIAPAAVEEMLRYLSVVQFGVFRRVVEDLPVGNVVFKEGEFVIAALSSGNRQESVFDRPDEIDFSRNASAHLTFGYGAHQCLGQQLARVELQEVFARLFTRIPTLRLGIPFEKIEFKHDALVYGVRSLPVTWDVQA
ncbi:cytochrome P450 [Crossiella sp. SN42]|uniref:cytochrome P450 n=1 Tax=Crossiella sp. SN42 TaxID=2944808 RepID=UPI00207CE95B|nr:cytochrome P450 [Crossiella sp. SN42]MCO1579814.1 cytochrome P450 [Crossiella sp. SN42]